MAAENKLDARQESAAYQAELDSGLRLPFRNRHAQETCVGREWFQLPILQMGWDKKNFSWRKASLGTAEISSETTNDRELPERGCFAGFIKIPLPDFE